MTINEQQIHIDSLPQELRPPMLVRQIGVQHTNAVTSATATATTESQTYILNIDDDDEYASSDEYDDDENKNEEEEDELEEQFENIYKNKIQFVYDDDTSVAPYVFKSDYYEEDEYEYEYAYEEDDDDEYCL